MTASWLGCCPCRSYNTAGHRRNSARPCKATEKASGSVSDPVLILGARSATIPPRIPALVSQRAQYRSARIFIYNSTRTLVILIGLGDGAAWKLSGRRNCRSETNTLLSIHVNHRPARTGHGIFLLGNPILRMQAGMNTERTYLLESFSWLPQRYLR